MNITSATLSSTNPNGVLHIDTTQARVGETSTITVNATDPATGTPTSQQFTVTVVANPNAATLPINLKPIAYSATQTYTVSPAQTSIQLSGDPANSGTSSGQTLTYTITTQPLHGTVTTPTSSGVVIYTPTAGYAGTDSFQFTVTNSGAHLTSSAATVNLSTTPSPPPRSTRSPRSPSLAMPRPIQLLGHTPVNGQAFSYSISTQPTKGTLTKLDATKGTVVYTANPGATGTDTFQYIVTNVGAPSSGVASQPATVTIDLRVLSPSPTPTPTTPTPTPSPSPSPTPTPLAFSYTHSDSRTAGHRPVREAPHHQVGEEEVDQGRGGDASADRFSKARQRT